MLGLLSKRLHTYQCLANLQAKSNTTVDGLNKQLQQARTMYTDAEAQNLSLEIKIGNQQREYRRSLRQAQVRYQCSHLILELLCFSTAMTGLSSVPCRTGQRML